MSGRLYAMSSIAVDTKQEHVFQKDALVHVFTVVLELNGCNNTIELVLRERVDT